MFESDIDINILVFTKSNKCTDIIFRTVDNILHHSEYYGDAWIDRGDIYFDLHTLNPFLNGLKIGDYVVYEVDEIAYVSGIDKNLIELINIGTLEEIKLNKSHIRGTIKHSTKSFLFEHGVRCISDKLIHTLTETQYNPDWDVRLYKSENNEHTDLYIKKSATIWWDKLNKNIRKTLTMKYFGIIEDINNINDLEKLIIYCKESECKSSYFYKPLKNLTLYVMDSNISEIGLSDEKKYVFANSYGFHEFNIHNNFKHRPLLFVLVADQLKPDDKCLFDTRTNCAANDGMIQNDNSGCIKPIKATYPQIFDEVPKLKKSFIDLFIDSEHKNVYELKLNEHFVDEYCIKIQTKIINLNRKEIYNLN